jgi:hypothetical protein
MAEPQEVLVPLQVGVLEVLLSLDQLEEPAVEIQAVQRVILERPEPTVIHLQ